MRKVLLGVMLGMALTAQPLWALRIGKPAVIQEWTPAAFAQLNSALEGLWNLTNGRYAIDITTTNPDSSRQGQPGESVIYNNAGSYKLCVNVSTNPGGTLWRCDASTLTAP